MSSGDFEVLSDEFQSILAPESQVERITAGLNLTEGPVWFAEGEYLLFSEIYGNRTLRWSERDGMTILRDPSRYANGQTRDRQGRLVVAGNTSRSIYRFEEDGEMTVLADGYDGKRLNSPNDIVVKSDDTVWFTDPPYGIRPERQELPASYVFRVDPDGVISAVAEDFTRPNGLAFSVDEKLLYIVDSHEDRNHIRVFDVRDDNTLTNGRLFHDIDPGHPDGLRLDTQGRIFTSAGDGIQVFAPDGMLLGKILCEEALTNCTFGGAGKRTLFMTARTGVFRVTLNVTGAQEP